MTPDSSEWKELIATFEEGAITGHEFVNRMFDLLTVQNVWEIGKQIDKKYFDMLAARLPELPDDDAGWSKMRSFSMGSFTGPVAPHDFNPMRRGVEAFRRYCLIPTKAQKEWKCLCWLCFPEAVEYGELVPDLFLFKDGDTYGLMQQSGHRGDYLLLFPEKPTPDPDPECVHEGDEISTASDVWVDVVSDWQEKLKLFPSEGHFLVESCKEAGWTYKDGHMLFWLFDRAGKMLEGKDVCVSSEQHGAGTEAQSDGSDANGTGEDTGAVAGPEGAD